jgi:virulence-associated protein VagC
MPKAVRFNKDRVRIYMKLIVFWIKKVLKEERK